MKESICETVRDAETSYLSGGVTIGEYVTWDMHDTLETIDAYLNSKHISGEMDALGREKPFFNIVTAASNVWYRATDLDRKNIRILPSRSDQVGLAFVATVLLNQWMRDARFGVFLNDWGRTLARYGSAVSKFVEKGGELIASVVPWNRLIVDPIQFDALPTIEKLYLTPAQLRNNPNYDQEIVKELLDAVTTRKTLDRQTQDNQSDFIEVYEVHGELDSRFLDDDWKETDNPTYVQQMHVISFLKTEKEYRDFCLYKGREAKHPYMITHLIEEDGRTLGIGAVEHLFNAQWMVNHSVKNMKDTLDLASKLIFQTSDPSFIGRNALSAIETGDILIWNQQYQPLTQLNNSKPDISAMQNFVSLWQSIGQDITSTPEAMRGDTLPSGTPYSLAAYLGGQAGSLFEIMTENKGLAIEDMMRTYVLPHLKKKMDTADEISVILEGDQIQELDAMYVPAEAVRRFNRQAVKGVIDYLETDNEASIPSPYQSDMAEGQVQKELSQLGNKRFFKPSDIPDKTWKEALKDFEMKVIVEVTNEQADKQAVMQTLATLYTTTAQTDPVKANLILSRIMTETGVFSPLQLATANQPAPALPPPNGGVTALSNNPSPNGQTQTSVTG